MRIFPINNAQHFGNSQPLKPLTKEEKTQETEKINKQGSPNPVSKEEKDTFIKTKDKDTKANKVNGK